MRSKRPKHIHDCDRCIFLGRHRKHDLYFCPSEPTIVARFSSEAYDYSSGLVFGLKDNTVLQQALKIALQNSEIRPVIIEYFETYHKEFPERVIKVRTILKEITNETY